MYTHISATGVMIRY